MSEPAAEPSAQPDIESSVTATADDELLAALAEEFATRLRRGEDPQVEECIERHPTLAERIRKIFQSVALMEQSRTIDMAGATESVGATIGRYKLLERIGEGGFGVVYMAEQLTPVRRKVALKVLKPGMDTRQVLARFEAERQALAIMDHANIARVLDAGATDSGRPYFVMELIKGEPITNYCDEHQLTPRERLALFAHVCQAVQHAHQKGIIHRDIKPSNVLVMQHDTTPLVKVIDFGVAKALGQELTEKTLFTGFAQLVGTPLYMSPEQAGESSLDVDTRSDIYSLGVLLYELLTGTTPFDKERFKQAAHNEIFRIIREEEPPKPSTRLSKSETLPSISAQRQMEPTKLTKLVRGDLDWIVMKALEKERTRRYETAIEMARDIDRYLHDEPVEACPPSVRYRLRKFLSRNKGPVAAVGIVLLALVAGIVGTTWGLVRAERALAREAQQAEAERQAKQEALAAAEAEKEAKQTAQTREAEARAVLDFVTNRIFAAARPEGVEGGLGRDVTLREALNAVLPSLENAFKDQPLIEAKLRMTLGLSYYFLGDDKVAHDQLQAAHALYSRHAAPDDLDALWSKSLLAMAYEVLGRLAEAAKLYEETLALRWAKLGPKHVDTLSNMSDLAGAYHGLGRHEESLPLNEETYALRKASLGVDHIDTLHTMGNLAQSYLAVGRHADALRLNEETLALRRSTLGPDHPYTLWSMNNVAETNFVMGRYTESLKLSEEVLALRQAKLGPDHRETLMSMQIVADSYVALGQSADAIKYYEVLLTQWEKKLGADHPGNADWSNRLAWCLAFSPDAKAQDSRRAVALAERAVMLAPEEGAFWQTLAAAHYRAGDWKAAVAALVRSISLKYYNQAIKWIEKSNIGNKVLRHEATGPPDSAARIALLPQLRRTHSQCAC
jgi:serine/threonine protein kinase/tetratricopeptide (TPR) repeat protein